MSEAPLLLTREDAVAVVTMNRPRAKNALDRALITALGATLADVAADASVRVVVLTGAGGSFCSGADLKAAMSEGGLGDLDRRIEEFHGLIRAVVNAPKPVIAMVDGPAVGFGCDLALACDLRFASPEAYFQEKFVKIGLMPDGGGTFWLPRLVGLGRAMEMMLTGDSVYGPRAYDLGLVNRLIPAEQLRDHTLAFAAELAKGPPLAYAAVKRATRMAWNGMIDQALSREKEGQIQCLSSGDCMEGVLAWMERREPRFQGK